MCVCLVYMCKHRFTYMRIYVCMHMVEASDPMEQERTPIDCTY